MLLQAAKSPHEDISQREAQLSSHLCEHLLYMQRQQRGLLGSMCSSLLQLQSQAALLGSLAAHPPLQCQVRHAELPSQ